MPTRIMVIDDEPLICRLLEYQLGGAGYHVTAYQDVYAALLAFSRSQPDLLLLDVMMPTISGWDLCRQIRTSSSIPIIMLTAKDGDDDVVRGLTGGADDYVGKPFNQAQLIARIEAVLRRSQPAPARTRSGATPPRGILAPVAPAFAHSAPLAMSAGVAPPLAAQRATRPTAQTAGPSAVATIGAPRAATPPSAPPDGAAPTPARMPALAATPTRTTTPVPHQAPAPAPAATPAPTRADGAPQPTQAPASRLPRLGQQLAAARRLRGLSLHEAGRASGVRWEFLQAIEQEEFSFVPRADLRTALRAYGSLLEVDLKPYAARAARRARPAPLPLTIGMVALLAIALVLVALVM